MRAEFVPLSVTCLSPMAGLPVVKRVRVTVPPSPGMNLSYLNVSLHNKLHFQFSVNSATRRTALIYILEDGKLLPFTAVKDEGLQLSLGLASLYSRQTNPGWATAEPLDWPTCLIGWLKGANRCALTTSGLLDAQCFHMLVQLLLGLLCSPA